MTSLWLAGFFKGAGTSWREDLFRFPLENDSIDYFTQRMKCAMRKTLSINISSISAVLVLAMYTFSSGCASSIPGSANIIPPGAEIPQGMAAFSGCWKGTFHIEGGGTRITTLTVMNIKSPTNVIIVYGYGPYLYSEGSGHYNDGKSGSYNLKARFDEENKLHAKFSLDDSITYSMNNDGTLKAQYTGKSPVTAIMTRVAVKN